MNQQQMRTAIMAQSNREFRRAKQNHKPRKVEKPHLAKHTLKGIGHGPNRHSS